VSIPNEKLEMIVASTTWKTESLVGIAVAVIVVLVASWLLRRFMQRQERALAARYRGDFASAKTRFELVQRVVVAFVVLIGTLAALVSIPATQPFAQTLLASSAVVALIAGLALRTPLANLAAGMQLAFTQPFRLGDRIEAGESVGVVDDIKLSYTVLRTDDGRRAFLPNEQLIASPILNATIEDPNRAETVLVPVSADADLDRVRTILEDVAATVAGRSETPAPSVRVTDVVPGVVTFALTVWVADGQAAAQVAGLLRVEACTRLRVEGVLARG
jgi:small-conductance mechanosensitive channel